MAIVDATRLNSFLSSPQWSLEQYEEASELLEEYEEQLGDLLMTKITPVPWVEDAAVLLSGTLATAHPVASVTSLDGVAVDDTHPLGPAWFHAPPPESRLRWVDPSNFPPTGPPQFSLMTGWSPIGRVPRVAGIGSVRISYMAGWGDVRALRIALLRKVGVVFLNRHDDSVQVRNLDSSEPPPLPTEEWTDEELRPLDVYRNLAAWK